MRGVMGKTSTLEDEQRIAGPEPGLVNRLAGGPVEARFVALVDSSVGSFSPAECRAALACVSDVRQWLAAFEASVILRMREVSEAEVVAVDLALSGRMNRGQVRGVLERAETLEQFDLFAGALSRGEVTSAHVDAVSRGMKTLGEEGAGLVEAQAQLLEQALVLPAEQFGKFLANEVERQSAEKANDEFQDQRRNTNLKWWNNKQGMVRLSGAFDPERGAYLVGRLENAVESLFHGSGGAVDPADLGPGIEANDHRRAVALLGLVAGAGGGFSGAAAAAESVTGGAVPVSPSVMSGSVCVECGAVSPAEDDSVGEPGAAATGSIGSTGAVPPKCRECGAELVSVSELLEIPQVVDAVSIAATRAEILVTVDLETLQSGVHGESVRRTSIGADLPVDVIRRMACEAAIVPVVLNGHGVVVDIGRARRLATRAQRQAIFAMHRTCAMPECSVRVSVCVPHHIDYWENGGRTDLANLVPLCSRHHHAVHEGGWKLTLSRDRTVTVTFPDGRSMSRELRESSPRFRQKDAGPPPF